MLNQLGPNVSRDENHILISGPAVNSDIARTICRGIELAVDRYGHREITLDFDECTAASQAAMLPLLPIVNQYRVQRAVDFSLLRPRSDAVDRTFVDGNWAHIIDPERHSGDSSFDDVVPALQFESEAEAMDLPDRILEVVMRSTAVGPMLLRQLEWSLYEILDNVINHANTEEGGFVQVTPLAEHVEFVVADAGIGIAASLGTNDQAEALQEAVRQGVTRNTATNQGNGLYGSLQVAVQSNGEFEIASYGATMRWPANGDHTDVETYDLRLPGTAVRARIGLAESGVLQRTLKFGGFEHDPPYSYVERQFETDEGETVFSVKERAARDVRTRRGGQRVRQQLENLLEDAEHITVDFAGVEVISSSFADEVFGRLFLSLGPRTFTKRVLLTNVNEDIDGLIDLAIDQRWRTSAGD